jgi:hypothetical protein
MIDDDDCGAVSGMSDWQGKMKYLEKACVSATLTTTNPTWPDSVLNPGHHSGKPVTNCLSPNKYIIVLELEITPKTHNVQNLWIQFGTIITGILTIASAFLKYYTSGCWLFQNLQNAQKFRPTVLGDSLEPFQIIILISIL